MFLQGLQDCWQVVAGFQFIKRGKPDTVNGIGGFVKKRCTAMIFSYFQQKRVFVARFLFLPNFE